MTTVALERCLRPVSRIGARAADAFRLGSWQVEPGLGRISTETVERAIEPKVMDVLVHLAARPGEVVSADELIAAVWAGRPMGDNPVHRCVSILRRALGDDAHKPRYIGTIPKRGYRVVARVESVAGASPWSDVQTAPIPMRIDITAVLAGLQMLADGHALHRVEIEHIAGIVRRIALDAPNE
jgi:DNA-binding winged helix-turn-helix (wHTH) protein